MKIAILGATGMLGHMVLNFFAKNTDYQILATARNKEEFNNSGRISWTLLDAQEADMVKIADIIKGCDYVINCIGIIKPYIHDDNAFEIERAMQVNALFPHKLAKAAEIVNAKVLQIATDCVYDGVAGEYIETDKHNALDVYGKTKSLGEVYSENLMNLRCSIIGPELKGKMSLLEWFLGQEKNASVNGFKNHLWNGVTTYQYAKICLGIIKENIEFTHLQHVVPEGFVSKAEMLEHFAKTYNRDDLSIINIDAKEAVNRTISTINPELNAKIWQAAGYSKIPTVFEMITELHAASATKCFNLQ